MNEEIGVRRIGFAEGRTDVARDLAAGTDRGPGVKVDANVFARVLVGATFHERDAIGDVDGGEPRGVGGEFVEASAFKSQGADAKIDARVADFHHLFGRELIGFGTCPGRHERVDLEIGPGNVLDKIT